MDERVLFVLCYIIKLSIYVGRRSQRILLCIFTVKMIFHSVTFYHAIHFVRGHLPPLLAMVHAVPLTSARFHQGSRLLSHPGVCNTIGLLPRRIPRSRPLMLLCYNRLLYNTKCQCLTCAHSHTSSK